jgi:hypothetical protein
MPARPYMARLRVFNLLIWPSAWPLSGMMPPTFKFPVVRCWTALW